MPEETRLSLQCQVDILKIELDCLKEQYKNLRNYTNTAINTLAVAIDELPKT